METIVNTILQLAPFLARLYDKLKPHTPVKARRRTRKRPKRNAMRAGTGAWEPNMMECALQKYPVGGQVVWLFMRSPGEASWSPVREATEADVRAFASAGKLLPGP